MKDVKCVDCDEYRNEWCEKVVDSPYPNMIRDCQYWHKRKDLVEVIRCKDCKWSDWYDTADGHRYCHCMETGASGRTADDFCSYAEREES